MNKLRLWGICCLLTTTCAAQKADSLYWNPQRVQKEGLRPVGTADFPFQFNACMKLVSRRERIGSVMHVHWVVEARWLYNQTFAVDSLRDRYTPLAQMLFDCYEIESRRMQEKVNSEPESPADWMVYFERQARVLAGRIRQETKDGQDTLRMKEWRVELDSLLRFVPRIFPPEYENVPFQIAADLGVGMLLTSGEIRNYFGTVVGWSYGGGIRYNRFVLDYAIVHTYPDPQKNFQVADFKFADTSNVRVSQASFLIGGQLIEKERWSVMPVAGISSYRVINRDEPKGSLYEKGRISLSPVCGIHTEWRFLPVYMNNHVRGSLKLIARVEWSPLNYLKVVSGNLLTGKIGFGYTLQTIRTLASDR